MPPPAPVTPLPPAAPSYILLTEILKASGTLACVDFLNFPNQEEQLAGIRGMLPATSGLVHAGMRYDLPSAMAVCRELGYKGIYSIKAIGLQGIRSRTRRRSSTACWRTCDWRLFFLVPARIDRFGRIRRDVHDRAVVIRKVAISVAAAFLTRTARPAASSWGS